MSGCGYVGAFQYKWLVLTAKAGDTVGHMGVPACPYCGQPNVPQHLCAWRPPPSSEPNDSQSFMERYRGTQWDTSLAPGRAPSVGPAAPAPEGYAGTPPPMYPSSPPQTHPGSHRERSGGTSLLLLAGIATFVVAFAVVVIAFMSQPPVTPIVALPPVTSRPVTQATAMPTAVPTQATSTASVPPQQASAVPTPSELAPLPDDPARAFATRMQRGDATYVVVCQGNFAIGNESATIDIETKVSGDDLDASVLVDQQRERVRLWIVVKDGVEYLRPVGSDWLRQGPPTAAPATHLLGLIEPEAWATLENVGHARRDGQTVHHLRVPRINWETLNTLFISQEQSSTIRTLNFDIWVTSSGVPVRAELTFDGTMREFGFEVDMTYELEYRFSNFGEPVTIEAPAEYEENGGQVTS